jgi:hypothetical protein
MFINPMSCDRPREEIQSFINSIQASRRSREDHTQILPLILSQMADFVADG